MDQPYREDGLVTNSLSRRVSKHPQHRPDILNRSRTRIAWYLGLADILRIQERFLAPLRSTTYWHQLLASTDPAEPGRGHQNANVPRKPIHQQRFKMVLPAAALKSTGESFWTGRETIYRLGKSTSRPAMASTRRSSQSIRSSLRSDNSTSRSKTVLRGKSFSFIPTQRQPFGSGGIKRTVTNGLESNATALASFTYSRPRSDKAEHPGAIAAHHNRRNVPGYSNMFGPGRAFAPPHQLQTQASRLSTAESIDHLHLANPTIGGEANPVTPGASTIHIDGAALGRWAVRHLEKTLSKPAVGMTGIDPRATLPRTRVAPF